MIQSLKNTDFTIACLRKVTSVKYRTGQEAGGKVNSCSDFNTMARDVRNVPLLLSLMSPPSWWLLLALLEPCLFRLVPVACMLHPTWCSVLNVQWPIQCECGFIHDIYFKTALRLLPGSTRSLTSGFPYNQSISHLVKKNVPLLQALLQTGVMQEITSHTNKISSLASSFALIIKTICIIGVQMKIPRYENSHVGHFAYR